MLFLYLEPQTHRFAHQRPLRVRGDRPVISPRPPIALQRRFEVVPSGIEKEILRYAQPPVELGLLHRVGLLSLARGGLDNEIRRPLFHPQLVGTPPSGPDALDDEDIGNDELLRVPLLVEEQQVARNVDVLACHVAFQHLPEADRLLDVQIGFAHGFPVRFRVVDCCSRQIERHGKPPFRSCSLSSAMDCYPS